MAKVAKKNVYCSLFAIWLCEINIYLMAHIPFRGGTDLHLGTDSPRREMFPARSLYPILRLTPYKGLLG